MFTDKSEENQTRLHEIPNKFHSILLKYLGRPIKITRDHVRFSSHLTVNIGSIRPEGQAPKTIDIAVAVQEGQSQ